MLVWKYKPPSVLVCNLYLHTNISGSCAVTKMFTIMLKLIDKRLPDTDKMKYNTEFLLLYIYCTCIKMHFSLTIVLLKC